MTRATRRPAPRVYVPADQQTESARPPFAVSVATVVIAAAIAFAVIAFAMATQREAARDTGPKVTVNVGTSGSAAPSASAESSTSAAPVVEHKCATSVACIALARQYPNDDVICIAKACGPATKAPTAVKAPARATVPAPRATSGACKSDCGISDPNGAGYYGPGTPRAPGEAMATVTTTDPYADTCDRSAEPDC